MTTNESERDAFEAWGKMYKWTEPDLISAYGAAWQAWQARAAIAQPAPFDLEAMLRDCIPGGTVCDPQKIADGIREYFASQPAADAGQGEAKPVAWLIDVEDEPELGHWLWETPGGEGHRSRPLYLAAPVAPHQDAGQAVAKWEARYISPIKKIAKPWIEIDAHEADERRANGWEVRALYAAPVAPQPLTDEEILAEWDKAWRTTPYPISMNKVVCATVRASRLGRAGEEDAADMFWNDEDPESSHSDIEEMIGYFGLVAGQELTVRRAVSLPNIRIRVIRGDGEGSGYEVIDAAIASEQPKGDA